MDNNTLSLLIAEMLGDVGKLHDAVERVNDSIPAVVGKLQGFIESIDKATATAQEVHQARLADAAVEQKAELVRESQAVLDVLTKASASVAELIESTKIAAMAELEMSQEAILSSVIDFSDSKISEVISKTIHDTLGAKLRELSDFEKEVAKLKKELQSVSTEMLEHRQRGAADMAIAVKAELAKAKPSFTLDLIKIVVGVCVGMSLLAWFPVLGHLFKN